MNISETIAPRSDQINAEDLLTGPRDIEIVDVRRGTTEQPVWIITKEFGPERPYKPSKTMRRVLVAAWGPDASIFPGRRIRIYRDPDIMFGRERVGGIRISHLSHIDERLELSLTVTRGRRQVFVIEPLAGESAGISSDDAAAFRALIDAATSLDELKRIADELKAVTLGTHRQALMAAWEARRNELKNGQA